MVVCCVCVLNLLKALHMPIHASYEQHHCFYWVLLQWVFMPYKDLASVQCWHFGQIRKWLELLQVNLLKDQYSYSSTVPICDPCSPWNCKFLMCRKFIPDGNTRCHVLVVPCLCRGVRKLLVATGQQMVDIGTTDGHTPLHVAAVNGLRQIAQLLVEMVSRKANTVKVIVESLYWHCRFVVANIICCSMSVILALWYNCLYLLGYRLPRL